MVLSHHVGQAIVQFCIIPGSLEGTDKKTRKEAETGIIV